MSLNQTRRQLHSLILKAQVCSNVASSLRRCTRRLLSTLQDSSGTLSRPIDSTNTTIRTDQSDARLHSPLDLSRYYSVSPETVSSLWLHKLLRPEFIARSKALHDMALMVRPPVLEGRDLLLELSSSGSLSPKIVLYGDEGNGKSCAFAHILQALHRSWMIVCPPRQYLWNNYFKEVAASNWKVSLDY